MIFDLNKDFFFGAIIWYVMLDCIVMAICGLLEVKRKDTYSAPDHLILAALCLGWVIA